VSVRTDELRERIRTLRDGGASTGSPQAAAVADLAAELASIDAEDRRLAVQRATDVIAGVAPDLIELLEHIENDVRSELAFDGAVRLVPGFDQVAATVDAIGQLRDALGRVPA
jgi:hypothetical protein